jgi:hypothetical protein
MMFLLDMTGEVWVAHVGYVLNMPNMSALNGKSMPGI